MATTLWTRSGLISALLAGSDLTAADTAWAMDQLVLGDASPARSPASTTGLSRLWVVHDGTAAEVVFDPRSLGLAPVSLAELRGGDAAFNARVLRGLVDGEPGPARDAVLLNAAAALVTLELGKGLLLEQFAECLERCRQAVDNENDTATLERWTNQSLAFR